MVLWFNLNAPDDAALWETIGPAVKVRRGSDMIRRLMSAGLHGGQGVAPTPPTVSGPAPITQSKTTPKAQAARKPTAEEQSAIDRAADNLLSAFD